MELKLNKKKICRITVLERGEHGEFVPETLWKAKKGRKVQPGLRKVDRVIRQAAKGQKAFADTLLKRHRRSNKKRKNGGLRELGANVFS